MLELGGGFEPSAVQSYAISPFTHSQDAIKELGRAVYYMDMADQVLKAKQILQMRKFEQKLLVAYKVYVNKFEKGAAVEARQILGHDILSMVMKKAMPVKIGLGRGLQNVFGHESPYSASSVIGPQDWYLKGLVDAAYARFSQAYPGTTMKQFIANLYWHDNGKIPEDPYKNSYDLPVLSREMIYLLSEGLRRAIDTACKDREILGQKVTPPTALRHEKAYAALQKMENRLLDMLAHPELKTKAKDVVSSKQSLAWLDHEGFFFVGDLLKAVHVEMMEVMATLFDGLIERSEFINNMPVSDVFTDRRYRDLGHLLPSVMFDTGRVKGQWNNVYLLERLRQVIRGSRVSPEGYLDALLSTNKLKKVGASWRSEFDGYEYFEVTDGKSDKRMLCRVYRGAVDVLHQGIDIFLDAQLDGEVPNPNYPASATGDLDGKDGLRTDLKKALPGEEIDAYRQWLAAPGRRFIKTKYLDEFYTHYAYPTS